MAESVNANTYQHIFTSHDDHVNDNRNELSCGGGGNGDGGGSGSNNWNE